ncbi:ST3 beta-galactoside alpha-2,3-sialyltransferase 3a isoform X1 [Ictalurus furcatus]|uniref:ST3 beta-galactoside alpha-2,3-sialyltransferase 3a isoform X1 n=1 Tax=Ictalurus furcatus TaxID=66913 RepID=UPI002351011A|nr:ST3 beta-galactoside alpha-2,3-sialyltransferase 3a isoform X1 [Ictalurus furcatus]XP_053492795.1 ST3 beta-galactoside alpha-2,3-sialyltransferase 3a isoform X1 [Ictalurus furcatus]XP_053492796.1 ST3 beta-galactoside alpha-2,3-sialyltransferase 3a isoform X1 [Ictalurus furcatus]XP_053492797.1 ST3 beta-galactoside alpha-2,3-sialyltransferase 3a isoform X1 [Ictalurus furcatus]
MRAMKPTRNVMLILCPMLVLGFLYYSSGRLHLRTWVQRPQVDKDSSFSVGRVVASGIVKAQIEPVKQGRVEVVYDKQGFLIKPDGRLLLELQYKYGNLSKEDCKPGYSGAKMTSIYPKFVKLAPMFLDQNFNRLSKIGTYPPPFGIKSQEKIINNILAETKKYGLGDDLDSLSCKKCIVIGNGGILFNKSLGSTIDKYDVVIRLNEAPVSGYEKDVGSKTTMRITYPEGAIQKPELYEKSSLFVLSAFKPSDFKWLKHIVFKEKLIPRGTDGFWKSVARAVPREAADMRILNPYFIQEAAFQFIGLPHNNGHMGRGNIPTLGTVAITMALHNCDEVAVVGFSYDMGNPQSPLHYYEKLKMLAIKDSWTHNISKEKEFLRKLVTAGVIQDLTNGI